MKQIIQTTIKELSDDEDLSIYVNSFQKYGWKKDEVEKLLKGGVARREGKLSDGCKLIETVEIKDKFQGVIVNG